MSIASLVIHKLSAKDIECQLLEQGDSTRREVNGRRYSPPEVAVGYTFENENVSDETIADKLAELILQKVALCSNQVGGRGKAYVTLREAVKITEEGLEDCVRYCAVSVLVV